MPFPTLSDDAGEQWQVHEAVMLRYRLLVDERGALQTARADARAQADAWVEQRRAGAV